MARQKGTLPLPFNAEVATNKPWDARLYVETLDDLTNYDEPDIMYQYMVVTVHADPDPAANGRYELQDIANYTNINNWKKVGTGGSDDTSERIDSLTLEDIGTSQVGLRRHFTQAEKNKLSELESSKFKGRFITLLALQNNYPNGEAGWYADVDDASGAIRYIWSSSTEEWVQSSGSSALTPAEIKSQYESNLDTNAFTDDEKAKLGKAPEDVTVALQAKADQTDLDSLHAVASSGNYNDLSNKPTIPTGVVVDSELDENSINAVANKAVASKLAELDNFIGLLVAPPNYLTPTVSFTNPGSTEEIGDTITKVLTVSYNSRNSNGTGGGAATAARIKQGSTVLVEVTGAGSASYNLSEVVQPGTKTFRGEVDYEQGPEAENELGIPDSRGRIPAGTAARNQSYTGRYRIFYGSAASVPTDSAGIRALSSAWNNTGSVSLSTGTSNATFIVAIPARDTSASSLSATDTTNNVDLSYAFQATVDVALPDGTLESYRVYSLTVGSPYPSSATHVISV